MISNEAINDLGQVAFIANQNSVPSVYRADPRGSTSVIPVLASPDGSGQRVALHRKAGGARLPLYFQSRGIASDRYALDSGLPNLGKA